jgi:hypothetical protein
MTCRPKSGNLGVASVYDGWMRRLEVQNALICI